MTSTTLSPIHVPSPGAGLRPELLDGITDAVISSSNQLGRAETISRLVREIYDSVAWIHPDSVDAELASLRRLVVAADTHAAQSADQAVRTLTSEVGS